LDKILDVVNEIIARDLVFGTMASEAYECIKEKKNMAALASLFILAEHAVKFSVNMVDGLFFNANKKAKDEGLISDQEFLLLDQLRKVRNKIFHENHYANIFKIDDIAYPFSEDETKEKILNMFMEPVLKIVLKLLKN